MIIRYSYQNRCRIEPQLFHVIKLQNNSSIISNLEVLQRKRKRSNIIDKFWRENNQRMIFANLIITFLIGYVSSFDGKSDIAPKDVSKSLAVPSSPRIQLLSDSILSRQGGKQ